MYLVSLPILLMGLTAGAARANVVPTEEVPLLGPAFVSNFDPTHSKAIENASETFPDVIESLFEAKTLNKTDLIFAVDVFSAATNESIYQYHHVGESQEDALTKGDLSDKSIFRLGSVSKLFTTYAIIAKAGIDIFAHPVTKYLPDLAREPSGDDNIIGHIRWEDVTVGALAAHQAGTGGLTALLSEYENQEDIRPQDLFEYMRTKHPVVAPFHSAVYSDGGYAVLGQVLASLSGQDYPDAIRDILFKPLRLGHMSVGTPEASDLDAIDRRSVDDASVWAVNSPISESTGGLFASGADLRAAGLSILNSELLSPSTTRQWMKPCSGTGSLVELAGAPWEIYRLAVPATGDSTATRISDLYTKGGGNGDYSAIFGLSPDHGIGFSVLVAGNSSLQARWPIRNAVGEVFIPAAEAAAAANAKENLAGTFVNQEQDGTNLTLSAEKNHPGLGVDSLYVQGVESSALLMGEAAPQPENGSLRLFPVGLNSFSRSLSSQYKTDGKMRVSHRMSSQHRPLKPRAATDGGQGGLFNDQMTWLSIDFGLNLDEFIFTVENGKLLSVENTGLNLTFTRLE